MTTTMTHVGDVAGLDVRLGSWSSDHVEHAVYMRRRLMVGLVLAALCATLWFTAHTVLADRGDVPASIPAVQPAFNEGSGAAAAVTAVNYIVQPGDTLWSIANERRGDASVDDYLERLVQSNGGPSIDAGQLLTLP